MIKEMDPAALRRIVRRNGWLIVLVMMVVLLPAVLYRLTRPVEYVTKVNLLARSARYEWIFSRELRPVADAGRDWRREFIYLGKSMPVARRASSLLGSQGSPGEILRRVSLRPFGSVQIILEATERSPEAAEALAKAWCAAFKAEVDSHYGGVRDIEKFTVLADTLLREFEDSCRELEAFLAQTGVAHGNAAGSGPDPELYELEQASRRLAELRLEGEDASTKADRERTEKRISALQAQLAAEDSRYYTLRLDRDQAAAAHGAIRRQITSLRAQHAVDPLGVDILDMSPPVRTHASWSGIGSFVVAIVAGVILGLWLAILREHLSAKTPR